MLSPLEQEILSSAIDDYFGLWEFKWNLRSKSPESGDAEVIAVAQSAALKLLLRGLIDVYQGIKFDGDEKKLSARGMESAIMDSENWNPPVRSELHIRIAATEAGELAYYTGNSNAQKT